MEKILFISVHKILIISIFLSIFISLDCQAQYLPLHGQLEVTDSIVGLSGLNKSHLSSLLYDKNGVTIWPIQPNELLPVDLQGKEIPYLRGSRYYAKINGKNLSVMMQSENRSLSLRGLVPALIGRENTFLCTSPENGSYKYDKRSTLIYYLLQRAFNNLKDKSAVPQGALLSGTPSYKSAFADRAFIFGHYILNADWIFFPQRNHNFKNAETAYESTNTTFHFLINNPISYLIYGWVYNSTNEDSKIFFNNDLWLKGPNSQGLMFGGMDFPLNLGIYGKKKTISDNSSAVCAMSWMAIDAVGVNVTNSFAAIGKNGSKILGVEEPDVLNRINMSRSNITWPSLAIFNLIPMDGSIMPSEDVLFSWDTSRNSSTKLFYREGGEANYRSETGMAASVHVLNLSLKWNTSYDFYVVSEDSGERVQSEPRKIFIGRGVAFTKKLYEAEIERDYAQKVFVAIKNTDNESHEITVDAKNPYSDILLGFVGNGSLNTTLTLKPGEEKSLELIVNAQDAMMNNYDVMASLNDTVEKNITDNALVRMAVHQPRFNIRITEIEEDKETLVKRFRIDNLGDTLTDFSVYLDDSIRKHAYLHPNIIHYKFVSGDSVYLYAVPVFTKDGEIIKGEMIASGAGKSVNYTLRFECSEGGKPYKAIADMPKYIMEFKEWYCPNNPNIKIPFVIPPGFNSSDVISAKLEMNFSLPWDRASYRPHSVYIYLNRKNVGNITNSIPEGIYEFQIDRDDLNLGNFSFGDNVLDIHTEHLPQTDYIVMTDIKLKLCLKKIERWLCAPSPSKASELIWETPGIEKNYPHLNVSILYPIERQLLDLGQNVPIKISVVGSETVGAPEKPQLDSAIKVTFNNSEKQLIPLDDGKHNDRQANDGIYACNWAPENSGSITIIAKAANCRSGIEGYDSVNVSVKRLMPDLNIMSLSVSPDKPFVRDNTTITFEVSNLGNAKSGNCTDILSINGKMIKSFPGGELLPGEHRICSSPYRFESMGLYNVSACSDGLGQVNESVENNNCNSLIIKVSPTPPRPKPDLVVSEIGFHKWVNQFGDKIVVTFNITNAGNNTAKESNSLLNIDGIKSYHTCSSLQPNETKNFSKLVDRLLEICNISVCSDSRGEVDELNEENNCRNATICTNGTICIKATTIPPTPNVTTIQLSNICINITDISGSNLTDYPVLIELSDKNFPDILRNVSQLRFSDAGHNTLNYWVEELNPSSRSAKIWVKVPSIPARGSSLIMLNISDSGNAIESNGYNTFEFFDDFKDGTLNKTLWNYTADSHTNVYEKDGNAIIQADPHIYANADLNSKISFEPPRAIRFRANLTNAQRNERIGMGFIGKNVCEDLNCVDGVYWRWQGKSLFAIHRYKTSNGVLTSFPNDVSSWVDKLAGYNTWEIKWSANQIEYYIDGKEVSSHPINNDVKKPMNRIPAGFSMNISAVGIPSEMDLDWVLIRQCVNPEPSIVVSQCARGNIL